MVTVQVTVRNIHNPLVSGVIPFGNPIGPKYNKKKIFFRAVDAAMDTFETSDGPARWFPFRSVNRHDVFNEHLLPPSCHHGL